MLWVLCVWLVLKQGLSSSGSGAQRASQCMYHGTKVLTSRVRPTVSGGSHARHRQSLLYPPVPVRVLFTEAAWETGSLRCALLFLSCLRKASTAQTSCFWGSFCDKHPHTALPGAALQDGPMDVGSLGGNAHCLLSYIVATALYNANWPLHCPIYCLQPCIVPTVLLWCLLSFMLPTALYTDYSPEYCLMHCNFNTTMCQAPLYQPCWSLTYLAIGSSV